MTYNDMFELKCELIRAHKKQNWLAEQLGCSPCYVSTRIAGKGDFTTSEAYRVLDALGLPETEFFRIFPRRA